MTQMIIGELRPEQIIFDLLVGDDRPEPLQDELNELLHARKLREVRAELEQSCNQVKDKESRFLCLARQTVLDTILKGPNATACLSPDSFRDEPRVREGLYLVAWCYRVTGHPDKAMWYLGKIERMKASEEFMARVKELKTETTAQLILSADRSNEPVLASAYAITYEDVSGHL